ncbi:MAG: hypothetical protein Q9187_002495, partial [Circinaria calcarea]
LPTLILGTQILNGRTMPSLLPKREPIYQREYQNQTKNEARIIHVRPSNGQYRWEREKDDDENCVTDSEEINGETPAA